ncbi:hypothetical protein H3C70_03375 [Patescibacteria group bacterium]|nr:hypothetical protein [Patescibacteria group bacterium]
MPNSAEFLHPASEPQHPPVSEAAETMPLPLTFQLVEGWAKRSDLTKKVSTKQQTVVVKAELPQPVQVAELLPLDPQPNVKGTQADPVPVNQENLPPEVATMPVEIQQKYLQTVRTATAHGLEFRLNLNSAAEKLIALGRMTSLLTSVMQFVSVACPHCAMAAAQTVTSAGRAFGLPGLGGLGHWHSDGTYHEGSHSHDTVGGSSGWIDNPFKWLEVDQSLTRRPAPALRKRAA